MQVDTKWGGAKTFFSGEGLFLLRCTGSGDMLVSSYGAIEQRALGAGEVLKIDTGHIVAFDEGIGYEVDKVGGWKSTLLSGEGLVADLHRPRHAVDADAQPRRLHRMADPPAPHPAQLTAPARRPRAAAPCSSR